MFFHVLRSTYQPSDDMPYLLTKVKISCVFLFIALVQPFLTFFHDATQAKIPDERRQLCFASRRLPTSAGP